jgi:hypothetical protein
VRVQVVVRGKNHLLRQLVALLVLAPAVAGCSGASNMFSSDLLSKDAEWFSRPGRLFISNVSIDAPPLTPNKPIAPDDLVSAEGGCSGVPAPTGTVALGHTECDVVRGIGAPDSVNISNNGRGDRVAVVTWLRGPRAGIYGFTAGRLSSVERAPEVEAAPKPARSPKPKRKPAAT